VGRDAVREVMSRYRSAILLDGDSRVGHTVVAFNFKSDNEHHNFNCTAR
jgi:hypothetical protein